MVLAVAIALPGCRKKEEKPVADEKPAQSVKQDLKAVSESAGKAAADFKTTADEAAREAGKAFQDFKSRVDGAVSKAKKDLEK